MSKKIKFVLIHNNCRDTKTAQSEFSLFYRFCEEYDIKCFDAKFFFDSNLDLNLNKDDILIVYNDFPKDSYLEERFKKIKCKKVLRTLDAYNSDGYPFKKSFNLSDRLNINKFIVAAESPTLNSALRERNISHTFLTHTFDFQKNINKNEKKYDISMSGMINWEVYPMRTRIFDYLKRHESENLNIAFLPHPGYDIKNRKHDIIGDKYIDFLGLSWLNIVCRGGWRDGLVAKYLEIGLARSLPIGDLPSYMHDDLKDLIIAVDYNNTNLDIKEKIYGALENKKELIERTDSYYEACKKHYDYKKSIPDMKKALKDL